MTEGKADGFVSRIFRLFYKHTNVTKYVAGIVPTVITASIAVFGFLNEIPVMFVVGVVAVALAAVVSALYIHFLDGELRLSEQILEKSNADLVLAQAELSNQSTQASEADETISHSFRLLTKSTTELETSMLDYTFLAINRMLPRSRRDDRIGKPSNELLTSKIRSRLKRVEERLTGHLELIANTAQNVMTVRKGVQCRANVKVIRLDASYQRYTYEVLAYSSKTPTQRKNVEPANSNNPKFLDKHALYSQLFAPKSERNHFICHRKVDLISLRNEGHFDAPTHPGEHYHSCLIVPVVAADKFPKLSVPPTPNDPREPLGIICVDCEDEEVFDSSYDLEIMTQISLSLFSAIRNYAAVMQMLEYWDKR